MQANARLAIAACGGGSDNAAPGAPPPSPATGSVGGMVVLAGSGAQLKLLTRRGVLIEEQGQTYMVGPAKPISARTD